MFILESRFKNWISPGGISRILEPNIKVQIVKRKNWKIRGIFRDLLASRQVFKFLRVFGSISQSVPDRHHLLAVSSSIMGPPPSHYRVIVMLFFCFLHLPTSPPPFPVLPFCFAPSFPSPANILQHSKWKNSIFYFQKSESMFLTRELGP